MGSLGGCLKRLQIAGAEADYIRSVAQSYRDDGVSGVEANRRAVTELIQTMERERASVVRQILEQHPTFMAAGKGETVSAAPVREAATIQIQNNAVAKLREMADRLERKADDTLSADRKTNTARRARMAGHAENAAFAEKAIAQTMRNLADAVESGEATHLSGLRTKAQVEMLDSMIEQAKYDKDRQDTKGSSVDYERQKHRKAEPEDAAFAKFPELLIDSTLMASLNRDLKDHPGTERVRMRLAKMASRSRDGQDVPIERADVEEIIEKYPTGHPSVKPPWQWTEAMGNIKRLESMGVTSLPELRAALREFIKYRGERGTIDKAKQLERNLIGHKGIGNDFFPTPKETAQRMVAEADIRPGMTVLEPSAGNGTIAEAIRAAGVNPDVVELSSSLREILEAKGFNVIGQDFLDMLDERHNAMAKRFAKAFTRAEIEKKLGVAVLGEERLALRSALDIYKKYPHTKEEPIVHRQYDRIVMNPPFSNSQDAEHVRHAYALLKPGGKLVAIVGEGLFFRNDAKATAFREWLAEHGGTEEKLPEGTFKETALMATTGANARLVVMEKPVADQGTALYEPAPVYQSEAFTRWFRDSQVVDANGNPLVVYHGTNDEFEQFEHDHPNRRDTGWLGRGFYFTSDPRIAGDYTALKAGMWSNVMPVYLRMENPYYATPKEKDTILLAEGRGDTDAARRRTDDLKSKGHDGIILKYEHRENGKNPIEYVVFRPEQVKSATGNRGTFDPANPSILAEDLTPGQQALENAPYAVREGEQPTRNFDIAHEAIGDLDRTDGVSHAGRDVYGPRVPARTVALGISPDLIRHGVVDLTGYHVAGPEDVAKLAQVYRDPRFETFRVLYVKDGQIVGHEGVTSRLPGLVKLFKSPEDADRRMQTMRTRMDALGATGYYLLHNHPSGDSTPSAHDRTLTERFAGTLPGFHGHVVVDSNEYSTLLADREGRIATETHTLDLGDDALLTPSIAHPLLDATIAAPSDVVAVGRAIQPEAGYATVIYTSGRGGKARSIQEVGIDFLADPARAAAYLKAQATAFGGQSIYVFTGPGVRRQFVNAMDRMIQRGVIRDYVASHDGRSSYSRLQDAQITRDQDVTMDTPISDIPSEQVGERASQYARSRRAPPDDLSLTLPGMEAPADEGRPTGTIDPPQARNRLKESKASLRPYLLGALGLAQIAQVYGKEHAEVSDYNKAAQAMEADFVEMTRASDKVAHAWTKLKIPVADKTAQVMEDARFLNFDPDPRENQEADSQKKKDLRARFEQLPEDANAVYRTARDFYTRLSTLRFKALKDRIMREGGTQKDVDELNVAYTSELQNVYFPYTRFGDYVVIAKKMEDGKEIDRDVKQFESVAEARKFAQLMKLKGWRVKQTVAKDYSREKDGGASTVVDKMKEIIERLAKRPELPGMRPDTDTLLDALNQSYLQSMPSLSYSKHYIHAKNVKGASKDALRAFAHSALHGAHHISRIRHADRMTGALMELDKRINETSEGDTIEARQVYNELVRRHDEILNPSTHPVAAWLGQLGFTMSLGGVVATGVTNATQVPLITFPWLGARYGFGKASAALARAYKDFLDPRTLNSDSLFDATAGLEKEIERLKKMPAQQKVAALEDEVKMLKELARRGRIDLTQTMDLAGLSAQDNLSRVAKQVGTTQQKVFKLLGFTFHAPEVMNRQVTALATFRLEREKGGSYEDALQRADQAIADTHFIYEAFNRPRYMSGNVLRVLTMFKQYSQHIAFLYGQAASIMMDRHNFTAEERAVAKRQVISMLALQFGAAGALGMPFFGASTDILMAVVAAFGDDDEKRDWEVALRRWLDGSATSLAEAFTDEKTAQAISKKTGEVLSHGLSRLTPFDMANRLGQQDLFFRSPQREREGRQATMDWLTSFSGPVVGYAVNGFLGVGDLAKGVREGNAGFFLRGVEEMTPAVIRNGVRALRYAVEDVRTRNQYKQLELRTDEMLGQAFGFGPRRVAEMYESVTAVRNKEHRVMKYRETLLDRFARAVASRDASGRQKVLEDIRAFNSRNRMFGITSDTLNRSVKGRRQHAAGMERGLYLPEKRRALLEEGEYANF